MKDYIRFIPLFHVFIVLVAKGSFIAKFSFKLGTLAYLDNLCISFRIFLKDIFTTYFGKKWKNGFIESVGRCYYYPFHHFNTIKN